jgi:hypothetical protein
MISRDSKITKKIPSTQVYLDERSRNPVSELNFIEFEKFATGRHPRGSKFRHQGTKAHFGGDPDSPPKGQPRSIHLIPNNTYLYTPTHLHIYTSTHLHIYTFHLFPYTPYAYTLLKKKKKETVTALLPCQK